MNIKEAYRVGKKLRSANDLEVTYKRVPKERYARVDNPNLIRAKVKGGSSVHKCEIMWVGKNFKVYCDCADFKYTFYKAINEVGACTKRIEQDTQSAGTGRIRHIDEPGLCKHLIALVDALREDNIL